MGRSDVGLLAPDASLAEDHDFLSVKVHGYLREEAAQACSDENQMQLEPPLPDELPKADFPIAAERLA